MSKITTHTQDAINRFAQQYKEKQSWVDLLTPIVDQIQELEDAFFEVLDERNVFTAIGEQLDLMGDTVGEPRAARNDTDYRAGIILRIGINVSNGTPEQLIVIYLALTGGAFVDAFDLFPATFLMQLGGLVPVGQESLIATELEKASPAGVRLELNQFDPADVFAFFDDPIGDTFSDTGAPSTGGTFASVVI